MILGFLLWFSLTAGLQDGGVKVNQYTYHAPPIAVEIAIHAERDWLDLYAIYRNDMSRNPPVWWQFWPKHDSYTVGALATIGAVQIRAEHQCTHPVVAYGMQPTVRFDSWYTKVEVSITSKPIVNGAASKGTH